MIFYLVIVVITLLLLLVTGFLWLRHWVEKPDANYVLKFIAKNPERSSLSIVRNGYKFADFQSDQLRPLASTVKIIVAIEYTQQVAKGEINPTEQIKLDVLANYYIPGTDGGAHEKWLKKIASQGLSQNGSVTMNEIVRGMISHSSNANTEYLMMLLGLDRINANLKRLQLPNHEQIFPLVSSLLVPYEVAQKHKLDILEKIDAKKVQTLLEKMPQALYIEETVKIHKKLRQDDDNSYKKQVNIKAWHNVEFDRIGSKRFTRSTTAEYVSVIQKVSDPYYFTNPIREHLQSIMEWPMEHTKNRERFRHLGGKGGSTAYIVTYALYAEDKQGNKIELAIFLYEVLGYETAKLSNSLSAFQLAILTESSHWQKKIHKAFY